MPAMEAGIADHGWTMARNRSAFALIFKATWNQF
jgi:hypothetical protein